MLFKKSESTLKALKFSIGLKGLTVKFEILI